MKHVFTLRRVTLDDANFVLRMRNKKFVRQSMINQNTISNKNHQKWFSSILKDETNACFIFEIDEKPGGVIGFFDIADHGFANWSFYLGYLNLPKGAGTHMCCLGLDFIFKNTDIEGIKTIILKGNTPSIKIHERLGFEYLKSDSENEQLEFQLNRSDWVSAP